MKIRQWGLLGWFVFVAQALVFARQAEKPVTAVTAPPKLVLLVRQQIKPGSEAAREKLAIAAARASDRLNVAAAWIEMQSISGAPEALFFDPLESYGEMDKDLALWSPLFAAHPELASLQERIAALVIHEETVIAVRRDDLSYRVPGIDLSKARYMRTLTVRLRPGHESDFAEAFRILSAAYEKMDADTPWVVYQVNAGAPAPCFLAFVPMHALKQNDDLLARSAKLREAEGEEGARRMQQIASEAYTSTESNVYFVSSAMSHVSREFGAADPDFWRPRAAPAAKPARDRAAAKTKD